MKKRVTCSFAGCALFVWASAGWGAVGEGAVGEGAVGEGQLNHLSMRYSLVDEL